MSNENQVEKPTLNIPLIPTEAESKPLIKNKGGRPAGLTRKARVFLELLCSGKKTVEAYRLAGYEGEDSAAYHLRSILRTQLMAMLKARGLSHEGIILELKHLAEAPSLEEANGAPLSFDQKLNLLKFLAKLTTETSALGRPRITPFTLNIEGAENVVVTGLEQPPADEPEGEDFEGRSAEGI